MARKKVKISHLFELINEKSFSKLGFGAKFELKSINFNFISKLLLCIVH